MSSRKNYRQRRDASDDEDEVEPGKDCEAPAKVEEIKVLQKFRRRQKGVSAADLAVGDKLAPEQTLEKDPFKLKTGGLVQMGAARRLEEVGEEVKRGTSFSSETNRLDEDVQMLKYIEEKMSQKKGKVKEKEVEKKNLTKEDLLYQVPESINVKSKIMKSEEMLSHQMLTGIPEVDLGIEAKIRNIEATEEAKLKVVDDSKKKRQESSEFVPTNMAANFLHHSRFYDEKKILEQDRRKDMAKRLEEQATERGKGPTVGGEIVESAADTSYMRQALAGDRKRSKVEKDAASDNYMFESFKRRAREGGWR